MGAAAVEKWRLGAWKDTKRGEKERERVGESIGPTSGGET